MLAWPEEGGAGALASSAKRRLQRPLAIAIAVGSVPGPDALRAIDNLRLNTGSLSALARDRVMDDAIGGTLPAILDSGAAALLPDTALCE